MTNAILFDIFLIVRTNKHKGKKIMALIMTPWAMRPKRWEFKGAHERAVENYNAKVLAAFEEQENAPVPEKAIKASFSSKSGLWTIREVNGKKKPRFVRGDFEKLKVFAHVNGFNRIIRGCIKTKV